MAKLTRMIVLTSMILSLSTFIQVEATSPVCSSSNVTELKDIPRRSSIYGVSAGEDMVDDLHLVDGWYSLPSGYDMLSFPPQPGRCGTYYPIWMNGTIPTPSAGEQPLVSCQTGTLAPCTKVYGNRIVNCGTHMRYYLVATNTQSGYCFDRTGFNPTGKVINPAPAFKPTSVSVRTQLTWVKVSITKNTFKELPNINFECKLNPAPTGRVLYYQVYWYVNGKLLHMPGPMPASQWGKTDLSESKLSQLGVTELGFTVKCNVRVKNGTYGLLSPTEASADFFAGIKIHTPTLTLKRGSTGRIIFQPTVPIGCAKTLILAPECKAASNTGLLVSMYDLDPKSKCDDHTKISTSHAESCGVQLDGTSWMDKTMNATVHWERNYTFYVTTTNDVNYDLKTNIFYVLLTTDAEAHGHQIWQSYLLPKIKIILTEDHGWKRKTCHAHVDPHMLTADGSTYECQWPGEYIVYNHTKYPMQVQMKTKSCNHNRAQCACAVSVRAGGDLFQIDRCGSHHLNGFTACDDQILDVLAVTEHKYRITLPIGTIVTITLHGGAYSNTMNIDIQMALKDLGFVEGLCGNFNGNKSEDFKLRDSGNVTSNIKKFAMSWKVQGNESLLSANQTLTPYPRTAHVCICPRHGSQEINYTLCSAKETVKCNNTFSRGNVNCKARTGGLHLRRRRMAIYTEDEATDSRRFKRSAPVSYAAAQSTCENSFKQHPNYGMRENLPVNSTFTMSVHECALDVNMTGDVSWAATHVESWIDTSKNLIEKDNTFRDTHAAVADTFNANACPNTCSGNGTCVNGTCDCDANLVAADCSIDSRNPPRVGEISNNGLCDWEYDDCCDGFSMFGEPFVLTTECRVEELTIYTDGSRSKIKIRKVDAHFRSSYEAVCPVDCTRGLSDRGPNGEHAFITTYNISVSNDGKHFGGRFPMMVYDSKCQTQSNDTKQISFNLKDGFCYIEDLCVANGQRNTKDHCFLCDVGEPYTWTRDASCDTVVATGGHGSSNAGRNHHRRHHSGSASLAPLNSVVFFSGSLLYLLMYA